MPNQPTRRPTHPWYKTRGYPHFDTAVSLQSIEPLVTNPGLVAKWQFYPLLRYAMIGDRARGIEQRYAKRRPISYAAHRDAHLYAYYAHQLSGLYEGIIRRDGLSENVIAFRKGTGKSTIEHAASVFAHIRSNPSCLALAFDVTGFFDNINHDILKKRWQGLLGDSRLPADHFAVFKSVTKYSVVHRAAAMHELRIGLRRADGMTARSPICTTRDFHKLIKDRNLVKTNAKPIGIPQGTPISALLSNVYMLDFDRDVKHEVERFGGRYWRYCDDIMVVVPAQGHGVRGYIENRIKTEGLVVNDAKTEAVYFLPNEDGSNRAMIEKGGGKRVAGSLQYLGFEFDGQRVMIRKKSLDRQIRRMHRAVRLAFQTKRKHDKKRAESNLPPRDLYKSKLLENHSPRGGRNFFAYGERTVKKLAGIDEASIPKQLLRHQRRLSRFIKRQQRGQ